MANATRTTAAMDNKSRGVASIKNNRQATQGNTNPQNLVLINSIDLASALTFDHLGNIVE